jgi:hypothetical protein
MGIAGNVISCVADIFLFVTTNLTKDDDTFKRTFILVDKKDVLRERQSRSKALTVIGTRQLHCVKAVAPGIIKPRRVSCTCLVCLDIEHGVCKNEAYVDEWVGSYDCSIEVGFSVLSFSGLVSVLCLFLLPSHL